MNMFGWIFSGVFLFFAALAVLVGALKGKKYTWMYSVSRLIVVVLSVILSVLIAKLASSLIAGALYGLAGGFASGNVADTLNSISTAKDLVKLVVTIVLAPILFYPVFLIVRGLMTLLVRPLVALLRVIVIAIVNKCKKGKKKEAAVEAEEAPVAETSAEPEEGKKKKKAKKAKKPGRKERKRLRYGVSGPNPIGAVCGALCSFMILCVFLIPIAGAFDLAEGFVELVIEEREAAQEASGEDGDVGDAILNTVLDIGDGLCNNAGTKIVNYTGGKPVYRWMISTKIGGERVYLEDELDFAATATGVFLHYEGQEPAQAAESIRKIGPAFSETQLIPGVAAEFLSKASEAWLENEEFMGIENPLKSYEADEMKSELVKDLLTVLKDTDEATVKADVTSVVNVLAAAVEHEAIDVVKGGDLLSLLKEQTLMEKIFYEILANDQLEVLAESTLDYGLELTLDKIEVRFHIAGAYDEMMAELEAVDANGTDAMAKKYADILDRYGIPNEENWVQVAADVVNGASIRDYVAANIVGSQSAFEEKTVIVTIDDVLATHAGQGSDRVTDAALEAKKLALGLYQMSQVLDQAPDGDTEGVWNMTALFDKFGPVLDTLASTEIIGYDETILFMTAFLQSPDICHGMKISTMNATSIAASIQKGTSAEGGFASLMQSMGKTLEMVQKAASDHSETLKKEDVQELIANMDTTTAEILQIMSTPEMIKEYGGSEVQDESAEKVSAMMGDVFVNLASAKENGTMTEEQLEKESKAVTQMMNVMMSAGERNDEAVFGENSVLGVDADEYVSTLFDSTVLSDTLVDTAYSGGDLEADPLKIGKALDESEKTELVSALNNQYQNASAAEKADENFQKKIYSSASVLNVNVVITANGVELAP